MFDFCLKVVVLKPDQSVYVLHPSSMDAASIGFIIILDRRKDKWNSAITSLSRIAVCTGSCWSFRTSSSTWCLQIQKYLSIYHTSSKTYFVLPWFTII